jgi:hypothetical protein
LTHFTPNATGGFDASIYPELTNGTPSLVGGIFTLPQVVNPGYVVILQSPGHTKKTGNWTDVIHFFDNGTGSVMGIQMLVGGSNQSSYYPSLHTVMGNPHAFIVKTQATAANGFTTFTDYSVKTQQTRNYHFYTGIFPLAAIPDAGSTLILLSLALVPLILFHRKLRQT